MAELDPEAYAKIYRRERLRGIYGRIAGYSLLFCVVALVFCPEPIRLITVGWAANARRASCASNLKQLGLAMEQYEQDSDGNLPTYQTNTGSPRWREATYPYVKSVWVYQCPDDRNASIGAGPSHLPSSYGAILLRGKDGLPVALMAPIPGGASINDPSQTIRLVDMRGYEGAEWNMTDPRFRPGTSRELYAHVPRHVFYEHPGGTINLLFADEHVKSMKPLTTLTPVNLWTRNHSAFIGQELQNAQAILKHAENE